MGERIRPTPCALFTATPTFPLFSSNSLHTATLRALLGRECVPLNINNEVEHVCETGECGGREDGTRDDADYDCGHISTRRSAVMQRAGTFNGRDASTENHQPRADLENSRHNLRPAVRPTRHRLLSTRGGGSRLRGCLDGLTLRSDNRLRRAFPFPPIPVLRHPRLTRDRKPASFAP